MVSSSPIELDSLSAVANRKENAVVTFGRFPAAQGRTRNAKPTTKANPRSEIDLGMSASKSRLKRFAKTEVRVLGSVILSSHDLRHCTRDRHRLDLRRFSQIIERLQQRVGITFRR